MGWAYFFMFVLLGAVVLVGIGVPPVMLVVLPAVIIGGFWNTSPIFALIVYGCAVLIALGLIAGFVEQRRARKQEAECIELCGREWVVAARRKNRGGRYREWRSADRIEKERV